MAVGRGRAEPGPKDRQLGDLGSGDRAEVSDCKARLSPTVYPLSIPFLYSFFFGVISNLKKM